MHLQIRQNNSNYANYIKTLETSVNEREMAHKIDTCPVMSTSRLHLGNRIGIPRFGYPREEIEFILAAGKMTHTVTYHWAIKYPKRQSIGY